LADLRRIQELLSTDRPFPIIATLAAGLELDSLSRVVSRLSMRWSTHAVYW